MDVGRPGGTEHRVQEPGPGGENPTQVHRRTRVALIAAATTAALVALGPASPAQLPPLVPEPTTTTTEAPPSTEEPASPPPATSEPTPDGQVPGPGDPGIGEPPPGDPRAIPPEAQQIIDSVPRTGSRSSRDLVDALGELVALGVTSEEAMRVGMGRFPIAGVATYTHDWLYPRWGPGFRFHLGTDVFAPHGTPIRAPVDGVATTGNDSLGGLTVRVTMPDGTFFYLAHLSGLAEGFVDGMEVETGEVVGFVGDSGNARGGAPHLHIGVYPQGGAPIDPKPLLDQFLDEALLRLPEVLEAYRAAGFGEPEGAATDDPQPSLPSLDVADVEVPTVSAGELSTQVLYAAGSNPAGGALALLESEVGALAASIDWEARAAATSAGRRLGTPLAGPR